eukprot:Rhum_TRINITY_DN14772_c4_g8::Rhum_TRINITY_DN14772_c4_g8_i1::g.115886::m.115886
MCPNSPWLTHAHFLQPNHLLRRRVSAERPRAQRDLALAVARECTQVLHHCIRPEEAVRSRPRRNPVTERHARRPVHKQVVPVRQHEVVHVRVPQHKRVHAAGVHGAREHPLAVPQHRVEGGKDDGVLARAVPSHAAHAHTPGTHRRAHDAEHLGVPAGGRRHAIALAHLIHAAPPPPFHSSDRDRAEAREAPAGGVEEHVPVAIVLAGGRGRPRRLLALLGTLGPRQARQADPRLAPARTAPEVPGVVVVDVDFESDAIVNVEAVEVKPLVSGGPVLVHELRPQKRDQVLEAPSPVVLHARVLEVVALLRQVCAVQRRQVVHAPPVERVRRRKGFEHLPVQVQAQVVQVGVPRGR